MNKKMVWTQEYHTLTEEDHLGDWSPEKDCCLWLTSITQGPVVQSPIKIIVD